MSYFCQCYKNVGTSCWHLVVASLPLCRFPPIIPVSWYSCLLVFYKSSPTLHRDWSVRPIEYNRGDVTSEVRL